MMEENDYSYLHHVTGHELWQNRKLVEAQMQANYAFFGKRVILTGDDVSCVFCGLRHEDHLYAFDDDENCQVNQLYVRDSDTQNPKSICWSRS